MKVCEEMKKLRNQLDKMGIEWIDMSEKWTMPDIDNHDKLQNYGINRTHFDYQKKHYSVINGFGTYGGYDLSECDNKGLLEVRLPNGDIMGYLTAADIIRLIKEIENNG